MADLATSDRYTNHLYAQRLNNAAASCIESGEHEKAVSILVRALRLSRSSLPDGASCGHCPSYCSLDECIVYSEERAALLEHDKARESYEPSSKRRKTNSSKRAVYSNIATNPLIKFPDENDSVYGYTHKTPILVTPTIMHEGLDMGPILSLIITFNLALSNHLKVLQLVSSKHGKDVATRERLGKVLRLYELAYQWEHECYNTRTECSNDECHEETQTPQHVQEENDSSTADSTRAEHRDREGTNACVASNCSSLRFDMIVCNNLGQIHRIAKNYSKQEKCFQHLLSILVFVVDWQRGQGNNSEDLVDATIANNDPNLQDSSEESNDNCTQQDDAPPQRQSTKRKRTFMNLDGFWRNISPFLLKDDCAKAA